MPIIRRSSCVPLPIVVCPVVAVVMLESRVARCVHCVENVVWLSQDRTDNYRQWNPAGSPDDGHKDARNMLRYYWLPVNHYLLHLVCFFFTYLSKMHGHSNIKSTYEISSESRKKGSHFAESISNIAVGKSRIVYEVWNELVVAVKRMELRGVYILSNERWSSAEAGNFTIFSGVIIGFQGDPVQCRWITTKCKFVTSFM